MKLCGLTGGVGMGKSTAARWFREQGIGVVDTDELARQLTQPGQTALNEIQTAFGAAIVGADGHLRRAALAEIVFADPAARQKLESILHPKIRQLWLAQVDAWRQENRPLGIVVIPLLFETRAEASFAKIICVACTPAAQQHRLQARGWMPEQINRRIAAQMPVENKIVQSDFLVWTEGEMQNHFAQLDRIMAALRTA
ncbi:MAG TPA: dephospho-CoA kinase [Verrucomicrobiae bacterium]|nr:dephospho-CoA kinase [Verrucomicrobiae bacterium]